MSVFQHPTAWRGLEAHVPDLLKTVTPINLIVEIGVDHGYSLFKFAELYPDAYVFGIDNFSYADGEHAKAWVKEHQPMYKNVQLIEMSSADAAVLHKGAVKVFNTQPYIDVLHIDADHAYTSVKQDFELWEPFVRPGGAVLFHDVISFPNDVGRFFNELPGSRSLISHHSGLGCWYKPG